VSRGPLARRSLELQAIDLPDQAARMAWLAEQVPKLPGSGIVYTLTVRDADRIAEWLRSEGIDAHAYHAGLDRERRPELEQLLRENRIKALVATVALGMGFDKPDLGWVVHYQRPGSVVAYYQQIGRAGRATDRATCVLLSGREDDAIHDFFLGQAFPPADLLREVAGAVERSDEGLTVQDIEGHVNRSRSRIDQCLKILEVDGAVVRYGTRYVRTAAPLELDEERTDRVVGQRRRELQQMRDFIELDTCLMEFAVRELDDPEAAPCGCCAVCLGGLLPTTVSDATVTRARAFINRSHFPIEPRKQAPPALTASKSRKIPDELQACPGFALSTYGDAGHGRLVKAGRAEGRFADALVDAAVQFIEGTWKPPVEWVTAVPSVRRPALVADVAERIAAALGIPSAAALVCREERPPQREMFNSELAAANAAAAFAALPEGIRPGPVLLIDDVVDSRWTIAMCAARLRRAGSGEVYPLALGSASGLGDW
jgi:ATP-dependent DNA helicase RecQ